MRRSLFSLTQEAQREEDVEEWKDFLKTWKNMSERAHTKRRCEQTSRKGTTFYA